MAIRQPIVVLVGHIDHGKSSILERIKGISITKAEAGGITQTIRSYDIPLKNVRTCCGDLLAQVGINVTIPGLLFLDSPGHAAFNNMRKRGGNLADIAILVVDVKEGMKEQTVECIEILKQYKTPFVIALNKIDTISGWREEHGKALLKNIEDQPENVKKELDQQLYTLVGKLAEHSLNAERFDRVDDFTQQVAIIPVSAKTNEGLPELLVTITGLAQRFLEKNLQIEVTGSGKATVLEVEEESGLGVTLDVIVYDGTLKVNDQIVIGTVNEPIVTKIRALFEPEGKKLKSVKEVHAAAGVKVSAPNIKEVAGGVPLRVVDQGGDVEKVKEEVKKEIEEVIIETDKDGVIAKADTLGSLEVLVGLLKKQHIPIKKALMGEITKKDIAEAQTEKNPLYQIVLGFNIKHVKDPIKVITHSVVYKIIEEYGVWKTEVEERLRKEQLATVTRPSKMRIMRGCIFRQSNPAVAGVRVLNGTVRTNIRLIKANGDKAGQIKQIQEEGKSIQEAEIEKEVAISIPEMTIGRQIKEDDILYSDLTESEFEALKKLKKYLKESEIEVLKEIVKIKRKDNPLWGV